jgi:mRNA interferase YafQ
MRKIISTSKFKKDYKLMAKRHKDMEKVQAVIGLLANDEVLPPALCDHALSGNWAGFRDCHVEPDWVLIYRKEDDESLELHDLTLARTGTHADLFKK